MIISLFWLIPSADQLARMCVILQKLSPPLASFSLQLTPHPPITTTTTLPLPPPTPPHSHASPCSVVSLLRAIHLSFHSLLWITAALRWESCPNTFALPKQSIAVCLLLPCLWVGVSAGGSGGALVKSLEVQQDSLYSKPLGALFLLFFYYYSWGPPSQPGCSDVRRAGHQPSGNVQAASHGGNRRTAQTRLAPSLLCPPSTLAPNPPIFFTPIQTHRERAYTRSIR